MIRRKENILQKNFSDEKLNIDQKFKKQLLLKLQNYSKDSQMSKHIPQLSLSQLTKQKRIIAFGSLAVASLIAVSLFAANIKSESLARQSEINEIVALPENLESVISIDKIQTLADADKPAGTTIAGVEIENEHGIVLYKVKFSDGSYRLYDAVTGLAYVKPSDDSSSAPVPTNFVAGISLQEARNIAQAQRAGKTITKIELETEEGVVVYSVRFSDEGRVDVNANDGSIVRVRSGDDSNDSSDDSDTSSSDDSSSDDNTSSDDINVENNDDSDRNRDDDSSSNSGSDDDDRDRNN